MHFKKLLALLVSAALMLSLLAGCGNGKALSQVIVDLLDNLYSNVSVEADSDLTAALKQAAAEGGTEEEILSRMIEILNHKGGSITFTRLGSGQQGDHAVTLYFQTGTDPDAAARNALAQWAGTLGTLPDDGSYQGDVAMIEAENGYYIALDVEVLKAGTPDKPDKDDDEPETQEPKDPYTDNKDGSYTINTKDGLQQLVEDLNWPADHTILSADITLDSDVDLQGFNWTPIGTSSQSPYTGTFDGRGHKISGLNAITPPSQYSGLFGYIKDATVRNLALDAPTVSCSSYNGYAGGVAAYMQNSIIENCQVSDGSISCTDNESTAGGIVGYVHIYDTKADENVVKNCQVSGVTISAKYAGGVAGNTSGEKSRIENCEVSRCEITSQVSGTNGNAGGIVGSQNWSTIQNCFAHDNTILATGPSGRAGGVVGSLSGNSTTLYITACGSTGNTITATVTPNGSAAGGVVGYTNGGTVTACFSADDTITGPVGDTGPEGNSRAGGVVGYATSKTSTVTECYWSGSLGAAGTSSYGTVTDCYEVGTDDDTGTPVTWSTVADAMNKAGGSQWQKNDSDSCPTLKNQ